jgi:hemolysin activation/secretion protein
VPIQVAEAGSLPDLKRVSEPMRMSGSEKKMARCPRRPLTLAVALLLGLGAGAHAQDAAKPPASATAPSPATAPATFEVMEYLVRGNTVLNALDIENTVEPFLGPGRSLTDVYAARDALQKFYQAKGFQSAVVEVPQQQVKSGVILLMVVENRIGHVRVEGAKYHSPQAVRDSVPALAEGQVPNFNSAQDELAEVNRQPGQQVVPLLKPGALPQTMDVTLKVDDHDPLHASVELNNDHSANTPDLRTVASVSYDNLFQRGQVASLTYIVAPQDRSAAEVYSFSYMAPLSDTWNLLGTAYKSNSDASTVGGTTVLGKGHAFSLQATHTLPTLGNFSQYVSVGVSAKHFDQNISLTGQTTKSPISYVPLTLTYGGQRATDTSNLGFSLAGNFGWRGLGSDGTSFDDQRYKSHENFAYLRADVDYTHRFAGDYQLVLHDSLQLSESPLVSSEQFAAGGVSSVRGYLSAEDTGDNGMVTSAELRTPSIASWLGAWASEWRFHVFTDAARLTLLDPLPEQRGRFTLLSTGVGTRFTIFQYISGEIDYAYPLKQGTTTQAHDGHVLFSLKAGL